MGEVRATRGVLGAVVRGLVCLGLSIGLAGCPNAADLENEERFAALDTGTGGTAGTGGVDCNQALPTDDGTCRYTAFVTTHCSRSSCHTESFHSADLDLTPNSLLIARILDVPAKHEAISCGVGMPCVASMGTCALCSSCPPEGTPLLSRTNVEESWILRKIDALNVDDPASSVNLMCGNRMPIAPGDMGYTTERKECLKLFFRKLAEIGQPCSVSTPTGGSGGGGAGGTPTSGTGGT